MQILHKYVPEKYTLSLFGFFSLFLLHFLSGSFSIFFIVSILIFVVLYFYLDDFFLSLYFLFFLTSQFLEPGKYYTVKTISPSLFLSKPYSSEGFSFAFGIMTSDIVSVGLIFFFLKKTIESIFSQKRNNQKLPPLLYKIFFSWLIFICFLFFSSVFTSFLPELSTVNAFQYGKMLVFFLATIFLLLQRNKKINVFLGSILISSILFHGLLGLKQSVLSIQLSQPTEQLEMVREGGQELRQISFFPRAVGGFLHANQLALFMWIFLLLLSEVWKDKNDWLFQISFVVSLLAIIFSQSRTVWLVIGFFVFVQYLLRPSFIKLKIASFIKMKYIRFIFFLLLPFILLRTYFSIFALESGGSLQIREEMVKEGMMVLRQSPIWGFGANSNEVVLYSLIPESYFFYFPAALHLAYLQLALEAGLVGLLFFLIPMFLILGSFWKKFRLKMFEKLSIWVVLSILLYYLFHPHGGRLELPFWGMIIAYNAVRIVRQKTWQK